MPYIYQRQNDISDYGADKLLRFDAVLKIFQEAAIEHSASVGYPMDSYMGNGNIWVLNRILIQTVKFPDFTKHLTVKTWSRGMDKFKGFRNYEIKADDELCIKGSSIWLYIDINKKRPVRLTQDMIENYKDDPECNMGRIIEHWDRKDAENYTSESVVGLRPADFDVNGHMNNIRYGEIISSVSQHIDFTGKTVGLFYNHEIMPGTQSVTVKYAEDGDSRIFGMYDDRLACLCEIF